MATFEFKLPDIGEGVVEGEIVKWLCAEGDELKEDQAMVEVMTDKATVTIPSPKKGKVMKLHGKEGDIARVHHNLITLEVEGTGNGASANGHAPSTAAKASPAAPAAMAKPTAREGKVLATPVTRRIAREHGVDLATLEGSGPNGRVLKTDVMAALESNAPASARNQVKAPAAPMQGDQRIPLKGLRKAIARKMVQSKFTAPHYTFVEEMDATELKNLRAKLNAKLADNEDSLKISFLPFICKALVAAMQKFPTINANTDEATQELVVRASKNLGIAVATDEGLVVPVVKDVQSKSLRTLADEIRTLADNARDRRLRQEDITGGTFTITSLGETGGLFATPIINHPEVAILGVHKMRQRPVVKDGQIVVRDMMYLSLSFDHRFIDGAVGAAFTYELIRFLESPELLLLELT